MSASEEFYVEFEIRSISRLAMWEKFLDIGNMESNGPLVNPKCRLMKNFMSGSRSGA
uniref:Uncharacterized protein n=1 Tax=Setaria digitata TaxID=48799 RepID=A0A915PBU4_9BILA